MSAGQQRGRRRRGRDIDGILLLDKPCGISSNGALQRAKWLLQAAKAGHTGNLDVQASGLLPLCFGEATKVCQFLLDADKHYLAEITLGRRTTTGDSEGETVYERDASGVTEAAVRAAMAGFLGAIEQVPPMHSALKQNGQPLYKLAHRGIEVPREKRTVTIFAFDLLAFAPPRLDVAVRCSKGTYIRTLAEDLGERLGCGAYVSALRRAGAGPYTLERAVTLDELEAAVGCDDESAVARLLQPADGALGHLPRVELGDDAAWYWSRGQAVRVARAPTAGLVRGYDEHGQFLGVGAVLDDGRIAPRRLFRVPSGANPGEAPGTTPGESPTADG